MYYYTTTIKKHGPHSYRFRGWSRQPATISWEALSSCKTTDRRWSSGDKPAYESSLMTNHLEGGANLSCFNHQSNRLSPGWHSVSCCCAKKIWDFCEFEPKFCIQWIGAGCNLQRGNQWENLLVETFQPADHLWSEGSLPFDSIFAANLFKFFPRKSVPACNKITPTKLQRFVRLKDARFIFSVTVLEDSLELSLSLI